MLYNKYLRRIVNKHKIMEQLLLLVLIISNRQLKVNLVIVVQDLVIQGALIMITQVLCILVG
jgi:hypothetical protein